MKTRHCSSCGSPNYYCKGLCKNCYNRDHIPTQWSEQFTKCVTCKTTEHPHVARGQCTRCYGKRQSTQLCQCGCGNYTALRGSKVKKFIRGHWLKQEGSDKIRPNMAGENNPQFGKFGKDHPSYGHTTTQKTRDERRTRRLKFLSERGKITGIESKLSTLLDKMDITHVPQTLLYNKFSVDEFLPKWNLVIEAYGGYWHGDQRKFPILSTQQEKTTKKDRSKEKYLNTCGHRILILWENELLHHEDWCRSEIEKSITKHLIPLTQDSIQGKP